MCNLKLLLCAGLSIGLLGCGGGTAQHGTVDPPKEMFDAQMLTGLLPDTRVIIDSQLPRNVTVEVVVYPDDPAIPGGEVAVDYTRTGWSDGLTEDTAKEMAAAEADNNLQVLMQAEHNNVKIHVKPGSASVHPKDTVMLHVRVPPRTQLKVTLKTGNIEVLGDLADVDAQTGSGDIKVRGTTGSITLKTDHGSLNVDDLRYRPEEHGTLDLEAAEGNIDIYAVNVSAIARTSKGNIHFVGSLAEGPDNSFATTEGGKITLALPSDLPYTFKALGAKQVINDFVSGTLVCGEAEDGALDFHSEKTPSTIGHTAVGHLITTTDYVTGTMFQNNYFLFHTNRSAVAKFMPESGSHKQQGGALWTPECNGPAQKNEIAKTHFTTQTGETGVIEVRLIRKH